MSYREIWTCDYCNSEIKNPRNRLILSLKPCSEPESGLEKAILSRFTIDVCPRCANKFANLMEHNLRFDSPIGDPFCSELPKVFKED